MTEQKNKINTALDKLPQRFWYIAAGILFGSSMIANSGPETTNAWHWFVNSIGWILLLLISLVAMVAKGIRKRSIKPQMMHVIPFLALAVSNLLFRAEIPIKARFFVSLPAMNRLAEQAKMDPDSILDEDWVGLYPIKDVSTFEGGFRFLVRWAGFLDPGGFAYSENGSPPYPPGIEECDFYGPLHGNWYLWSHVPNYCLDQSWFTSNN